MSNFGEELKRPRYQWKWNWIGHTLRKGQNTIEREVMDWNPQGQRKRGRPKQTWRRSVHNGVLGEVKSWNEVKQLARNRIRWRRFVDALCPWRDNRLWWRWWLCTQSAAVVLFLFKTVTCFNPWGSRSGTNVERSVSGEHLKFLFLLKRSLL